MVYNCPNFEDQIFLTNSAYWTADYGAICLSLRLAKPILKIEF